MKKLLATLTLLLACAVGAGAQQPRVTITQGGNDANVTAGNAFKIDITSIVGNAAATAASGIMKVGVTDGSGTAITSTGGALDINIKSGGASGGTSLADAAVFTEGTTSLTPAGCYFQTTPTNLATGHAGAFSCTTDRSLFINLNKVGGTAVTLGSKTSANSFPVVIASDQGAVAVSQSGTWTVQPGNTANTTAWLVTGTGGTFPATESGTWTVQPGNTANTTPWLHTSIPSSASAAASTVFYNQAVTTAATVKATAGNVYGWSVFNPNSSVCYLQVFNTTSPTLGTTVPLFSIPVTNGLANIAPPGGVALNNFSTAIAIASTTTAQGATTCTTGMVANVWYQ